MRLPSRYTTVGLGINMTPMIDVVFLLIIFFLVSSHLARREHRIKLPLPTACTGEESGDDQIPRITLNVLSDGSLMLAGRPLPLSQLCEMLIAQRTTMGNDLELRIRADQHLAYRVVSPLLLDAAKAGIWKVHFAVFAEES